MRLAPGSDVEQTARCLLCDGVVTRVPATDPTKLGYPPDAVRHVYRGRTFIHLGDALLHHDCSSPQATTNDEPYWDPESSWWACMQPDRDPDLDIHFDLHCAACATRWGEVRGRLPEIAVEGGL